MRWTIILILGLGCAGGDINPDKLEVDLPRRDPGQTCPSRTLPPVDDYCKELPAPTCVSNDDCTEGDNGVCTLHSYGGDCDCRYDACSSDTDCGAGGVCACANDPLYDNRTVSWCIYGDCRSDADCDSELCLGNHGFWCGTAEHDDPLPVTGWFCATDSDTCRSDAECDQYDRCMFGASSNPTGFSCSRDYDATCD